ncbi:MAG: M4 family metallopeptidase [Clostridiales bacterium]|nr:M4 family metallopeptidase [Clostridiales bacterium]
MKKQRMRWVGLACLIVVCFVQIFSVCAAMAAEDFYSIHVGETVNLKVSGGWFSATDWVSSDETVVEVSSKGLAVGTGEGEATITATTVSAFSYFLYRIGLRDSDHSTIRIFQFEVSADEIVEGSEADVTGEADAEGEIDAPDETDETEYSLRVGESLALPVASAQARWRSSDDGVAVVSDDGTVTGVGNGDAIITVSSGNSDSPSGGLLRSLIRRVLSFLGIYRPSEDADTDVAAVTYMVHVKERSESYTVFFETDGGSEIEPVQVEEGGTLSDPGEPVKDGFLFSGWYVDAEQSEYFTFEGDVIVSDTTLYAGWIADDADMIVAEYAAGMLVIEYAQGDSAEHVTRDIGLPLAVDGVDDIGISWSSSMESVLTADGVVVRPEEDMDVTMTVSVSCGDAVTERVFTLCVIHRNQRNADEISNHSVIDIQQMNDYDAEIVYNEEQTQVTSIDGQYSEIVVENADDALDVLQNIHSVIGLSDPYEETELQVVNSDEYGAEYTFNQMYQGYQVYGRRITVSADAEGCTDFLTSGILATSVIESAQPSVVLSAEEAQSRALEDCGGSCEVTGNVEIVLYSLNDFADVPVYAYLVPVEGEDRDGEYRNGKVFVNAENGEIILFETNYISDSVKQGSGKDELGNQVSFPIRFTWTDFWFYYMTDTSRHIVMYDGNGLLPDGRIGSEFNLWLDHQAISAYTNMRTIIQWWKDTFNRDSLDNNGMTLRVIAHQETLSVSSNNAWWDGVDAIHITDASGNVVKYSRAVATDVLTHESTHGVVQYITGGLAYQNAPGAINEGYADLFGCFMNQNWTHGEALYTSSSTNSNGVLINCTRNVADPDDTHALSKGPDRLSDPLYHDYTNDAAPDESNDYGGVHTNGSLVSHAGYLMHSYGMSWATLQKLWYKSLSMGYDNTSTFFSVRENVLKAAKKIKLSETEIERIKRAFDEEEIYDRGTLTGTVMDSDGQRISGAVVSVYDGDNVVESSVTGEEGEYSFYVDSGTYTAVITAEEYVDFSSAVTITRDTETTLLAVLVKEGEGTAEGTIVSATTAMPLDAVTLNIREGFNITGGDILASTVTDGSGNYSISLDAGYYTFQMQREDYTETSMNIVVEGGQTVTANGSMSPIMDSDVYRVVLTWGLMPFDLDSHLEGKTGDGTGFHIYFHDKYAADSEGTEIGNLDVDDTTSYGPETITFHVDTDGSYYYYVYRYSMFGVLAQSSANVKVYCGDVLVGDYDIDATADSSYRYWNVFKIVNGIFATTDTVTSSASRN